MFSLSTIYIAISVKEPKIILESSFHIDFCVKTLMKAFQGDGKKYNPSISKKAIDSK